VLKNWFGWKLLCEKFAIQNYEIDESRQNWSIRAHVVFIALICVFKKDESDIFDALHHEQHNLSQKTY
jgi:hypothetical protein